MLYCFQLGMVLINMWWCSVDTRTYGRACAKLAGRCCGGGHAAAGPARVEAKLVADIFRARIVDTTNAGFIFEITGAPSKIDKFVGLMRPMGLLEVSRTGVLSIERGAGAD